MARIPGGTLAPDVKPDGGVAAPIPIAPFSLDRRLVTAGEFARFVHKHPEWRRARVGRIQAESDYLKSWRSDEDPGDAAARARPVTSVSWFAARAYCADSGKRLPTTDEWEYAARSGDPDFANKALAWYAHPTATPLPPAGKTPPDGNGVRDLGNVVWEWTEDFNAEIPPEGTSCGAGATGATDKTDYAAFMRRAFRSSLRGDYTLPNVGFRCASDAGR